MISTALFAFKGSSVVQWPVILAGVMIVIVPVLIVFIVLQKYIYNGVTGAVKSKYQVLHGQSNGFI